MGFEPKIGGKHPKSSILIGFSIVNHPFLGFSPYFWVDTHMFSVGQRFVSGDSPNKQLRNHVWVIFWRGGFINFYLWLQHET